MLDVVSRLLVPVSYAVTPRLLRRGPRLVDGFTMFDLIVTLLQLLSVLVGIALLAVAFIVL